jgi:hypothetical protein
MRPDFSMSIAELESMWLSYLRTHVEGQSLADFVQQLRPELTPGMVFAVVGGIRQLGKSPDELVLCVALRHCGVEREVLVLKAEGQEFYAFPPYAKEPFGIFDCHISWHASGKRHAVMSVFNGSEWKKDPTMQTQSTVNVGPPMSIKGAGLLYHSPVPRGKFLEGLPVGTNQGLSIVLDADAARFRDDFFVIRAYLVEPGAADSIPIAPNTGPRILHLVKETTPWLAVEVYQETERQHSILAETNDAPAR